MVEDGLINQHSFGYKTIKETYDNSVKANRLKELMIYEGSSVQFLGANENTPILGVKNFEDAMNYIAKLDKFIKTYYSNRWYINKNRYAIKITNNYFGADDCHSKEWWADWCKKW